METDKRIEELVATLNKACISYYKHDNPIMSDKEYDDLYEELESLERDTGYVMAESPTQKVQGDVLECLKKVIHKRPMLSANKTKDLNDIRKFIADKSVVQSWKLDGLTVVAEYRKGVLYQAVTRGNGTIGEDVTHTFRHCANLPRHLREPVDITFRGECVISWQTFEEINAGLETPYSHPRNLAAGTLRQLDSNIAKERCLEYYVFDIIEDPMGMSLYQMYQYAIELGMPVVKHDLIKKEDDILSYYTAYNSNTYNLPVDGLIYRYNDLRYGRSLGATSHHPLDMIALKWEDELYETTLTGIEWQTSRTGLINPVAIFEPVDLDGAITTRATLHNISYIEGLELGIGDRIQIYRSNMVIPKIHENLTRSNTWELPEKCPACGGEICIRQENDSKTLHCKNINCNAILFQKLVHAVSKNALNIDGISKSTLEKLIKIKAVDGLKSIYYLRNSKEKLSNIDGFGKRSVDKMLSSIETSRSTTLDRFIYSLSIPLIGQAASKDISDICVGDYNAFVRYMEESPIIFRKIDGFGEVMYNELTSWWNEYWYVVDDLSKEFSFKKNNPVSKQRKLEGKIFVITGTLEKFENRNAVKEAIELSGGKVSGSVSKNTFALVNNDIHSDSAKNRRAKELGVKIITEDQLISLLNG